MTEEQKALLNRRIAEARGWTVEPDGKFYRIIQPNKQSIGPSYSDPYFGLKEEAPDYLSSDSANCELLDSMCVKPYRAVLDCDWHGNRLVRVMRQKETVCQSPWTDRRTAVALAWARWKGVSLEGII